MVGKMCQNITEYHLVDESNHSHISTFNNCYIWGIYNKKKSNPLRVCVQKEEIPWETKASIYKYGVVIQNFYCKCMWT